MTENPLPLAQAALDRIARNAKNGIGCMLSADEVYELAMTGFMDRNQQENQE